MKMERLTYWNNKKKGFALPVAINDNGDTVDLETLCAKLAAYEDTGLEPSEIPTGLELANVFAAMQELKRYKDAEKQGKLHIAPVADGTTIFIPREYNELFDEPQHIAQDIYIFGYTEIVHGEIGKGCFLTRKAAINGYEDGMEDSNV